MKLVGGGVERMNKKHTCRAGCGQIEAGRCHERQDGSCTNEAVVKLQSTQQRDDLRGVTIKKKPGERGMIKPTIPNEYQDGRSETRPTTPRGAR